MRISIITNDVDGCLSDKVPSDGINFDKKTKIDIEMYANFIKYHKNREFILCSGRALHQLKGIINIAEKIRWVICENGSIIVDLNKNKKIDLAKNHPSKKTIKKVIEHAKQFASEKQVPKKFNMMTIDARKESGLSLFNRYMKVIPKELLEECKKNGITFNWDPLAINATLPITKQDGLKALFELITKEKKIKCEELKKRTAYIGDSTSDIEGMKISYFAATPKNGDQKNLEVCEYLKKERIPNGTGYISPYPYSKGNLDCLKHIIKLK